MAKNALRGVAELWVFSVICEYGSGRSLTKKGNKFLKLKNLWGFWVGEEAKEEAILNSFVKFMTTPAVIICETTHQKKTSTNKNEELKLAWNWIFSNTLLTIPSFWGMNVKHLITNWQDFLRKNIWHFFTDSGFYTVGYLILKRSLIFEWMGSKKSLV